MHTIGRRGSKVKHLVCHFLAHDKDVWYPVDETIVGQDKHFGKGTSSVATSCDQMAEVQQAKPNNPWINSEKCTMTIKRHGEPSQIVIWKRKSYVGQQLIVGQFLSSEDLSSSDVLSRVSDATIRWRWFVAWIVFIARLWKWCNKETESRCLIERTSSHWDPTN